MNQDITVAELTGQHIGQHVTIKTKHTEASGVLQGFKHETATINDSGITGDNWILGATTSSITILPGQRITATMEDEIVIHGYDEPEAPAYQSAALKIINDNPDAFLPKAEEHGWQVGDTAQYLGEAGGFHIYREAGPAPREGWEYQDTERHCGCVEEQELAGPNMYASGNAQPSPARICDNRNATHQAKIDGGEQLPPGSTQP